MPENETDLCKRLSGKRGFCRNNQANHISFDSQAQQAAASQIICCYVINKAIAMHYAINHVIANCGYSCFCYGKLL